MVIRYRIVLTALLCSAALLACIHVANGQNTPKKTGVVAPGAELKKLATGFTWAEGPVEDREGNLFFTDNRNNLLYKMPPDGAAEVFLKEAHRANGLYLDRDGKIIACTGAPGQIASIDSKGGITVIADSFEGKPFNAPNDLWLDPKGGIYFTDPFWGRENGRDRVMYLSPDRTKLIAAAGDMVKPNGIIGTPDGKLVYVSDWNEKKTYVYTVNKDGSLSGKRLFAPEGDDGLAIDTEGNVYLTGDAVTVYNPAGEKIDTIAVPETAANVCFGGKDKQTLFITARTSVYSIRTRIKGL
ncbi:SMP-30/gluconolactonase/LRE family protein [bacterium]|nr:SMP-30/gluconolactonase/LRE family protein [bacterium]